MKRILRAGTRFSIHRQNFYHPHLEQLEHRLPPGVVIRQGLWPSAAVNPSSWVQPTPASEIALVERPADRTPSEGNAESTNFRWTDARITAFDAVDWKNEDLALASDKLFLTPFPGDQDSVPDAVSTIPPVALTGTPAAQMLIGGASAMNSADSLGISINPGASVSAPLPPPQTAGHLPGPVGTSPNAAPLALAKQSQVLGNFGQLPLHFDANQGQADASVRFLSPGSGSTLFLTGNGAVLSLRQAVADSATAPTPTRNGELDMQVVGANPNAQPVGEQELPGKVNYFLGNDPAHWHTDIPTYARVDYPEIYNGINLVYYGNQQQLEYDFVVQPGADPRKITLGFHGADQVQIGAEGDLLLQTAVGVVRQLKPTVYQDVNGSRQRIAASYVLKGPDHVAFQLGTYDSSRILVIDPVLAYSTYLGGSMDDLGNAIAVDNAGNVYVTGDTTSPDFPTANPIEPTYGGGTSNAFVAKLDPTGSTLLYSTYLGGENFDRGNGIAVDASGAVYVVGKTNSRVFPITHGAFEDSFRGDEYDAFVTKIGPAGDHLNYSTYLGGDANDSGIAIAIDSSGNAYVTGGTRSNDFPVTQTAYQGAVEGGPNAFITELNATGTDVLYSTFLGGSNSDRGNAIAVDANGYIYVTGHTNSDDFPTKNALQPTYGGGLDNAFVAKLDPRASGDDSLIYSTFLGGSQKDRGLGIALDSTGNIYIAGDTSSAVDFPIVNAVQPTYGGGTSNAFVAKINNAGTELLFATYLGGSGGDGASGLALDANGNIYLTGTTYSLDFPTVNAFQAVSGGGQDAFVAKLTSDGSTLVYSSYLGGSGDENVPQNGVNGGAIAVDAAGAVYVTGNTTSSDFPTVNPLQPVLAGTTSAFVAKITE
ncbi:MAG TPA: SBBP repeat-containing protein [Gemmataceae bacterium]|nr:SBBP repeat-containing protein [Gemmataceae bacterium]